VIVVPVELADRSYDVVIGPGARHELARVISGLAGVRHAAVVTQPAIAAAGWLEDLDCPVPFDVHMLGEGEGSKSLSSVETLCGQLARSGLTRSDVVIAFGGGIVTDVAGFAAAVYHRGTRCVNVATSLLAQVDAAIGGKTGVNLPEGKNLVGAFWQPSAVLCDTEVLDRLPPREYLSGCGEVAKYHFLGGTDLLDLPLDERIARCVAIKAEIVGSDERESGRRAVLNYGHTLAHALETAGHYDLRHGEAVAIGLVYAARLARRLGRIDDARVDEHRKVVGGYDLPTSLPRGLDHGQLVGLMARDKKATSGLTFVLDGPRGVETVAGVDERHVRDVLDEMVAP